MDVGSGPPAIIYHCELRGPPSAAVPRNDATNYILPFVTNSKRIDEVVHSYLLSDNVLQVGHQLESRSKYMYRTLILTDACDKSDVDTTDLICPNRRTEDRNLSQRNLDQGY